MTLIAYFLTGLVSGFLAGLLGVGGGLVIVPVLTFFFESESLQPEHAFHFALGTSLACIVFTSFSSLTVHNRHHAVNWQVFRLTAPGILIGTFFGSQLAVRLPPAPLKAFFAIFACYTAIRLFFDIRPDRKRGLPGPFGMTASGILIGMVSSLAGIGGGSICVPFFSWCNLKMTEAIGTSSAVVFSVALAATIWYGMEGFSMEGLGHYSAGFVYLPALLFLVAGSVPAVPLGAKLAHRLPVARLKKVFAFLLLAICIKMII
ncbi:MAG TPA: sulfite exporter TauE/SafE family protein [Burkholderiales bacterium]|nr:sulfite exporter TauE/SafE family protein [Burkholderiales bacterium]